MSKVKCSVFIAMSLDGYIAREDGSIDWLMKANELVPKGEDGGYQAFISTVDTIVMGRRSFEKVVTFDSWPYSIPVIVLSQHGIDISHALQNTVSLSAEDPKSLVDRLSAQGVKHLYVDGGITIQRFLTAGLIEDMIITVIPVLLGKGRRLFGSLPSDIELKLLETQAIGRGLVQMRYHVGSWNNA